MSQDKFWLQFNNGKKEQLNDAKHGVRKEQVDKKYHNLFDGMIQIMMEHLKKMNLKP